MVSTEDPNVVERIVPALGHVGAGAKDAIPALRRVVAARGPASLVQAARDAMRAIERG